MRKTDDGPRFWGDESGQAIVFGVLTLFMLVLTIVVVYNVGAVVAERIQLQQAADAAATAGAQIEANAVSSIAWMNDGMAYIYYNICRYAVDVGIYGTLAELKEVGPPYPGDDVVGTIDSVEKYNEAYARAATWIPRGETMLDQISKIEAAIALATPILVEMEVYRAAEENGAEGATMFPKFVMFPDPDSHFILDIIKIPGGWEMISDRGDEIIAQVIGPESWWISATQGSRTVEMSVDRTGENTFKIVYTDEDGTKTIYIERTPYGDIIVEGDNSLTITQNDDGSTTITQNGESITYRITDDGTLEVKEGNEWVPIENEESVSVEGGPEIRVDNFTSLQVGDNTWVAPNSVWVYNIHITLTDPISITGQMGIASISVQENSAVVNGLSTANADGKWHVWWHGQPRAGDTQMQDRTRHRMTELMEDQQWQYEWVRTSSYFFPDNKQRFVSHALRDNDPTFQDDGAYPAWCTLYQDQTGRIGWFDMAAGRPNNWEDYYQRRLCWHPNEPPDYDGYWIDLTTGATVTCPVCRAIDSDGDGRTDVVVTQRDSLNRAGNPGFDSNGVDRQSVDTQKFEMPFVLTEAFFKFGINVGVWGNVTDVTRGLISNADWGMFAVSSARIGFRDPATGNFTTRFATSEDRTDWVDNSVQNLYEPTWEFRMVSTRDAILGEDIDVIEENETGANYLYRGMANSTWRDGYYGSVDRGIGRSMRSMTSPRDRRFDITARRFEEVIKH